MATKYVNILGVDIEVLGMALETGTRPSYQLTFPHITYLFRPITVEVGSSVADGWRIWFIPENAERKFYKDSYTLEQAVDEAKTHFCNRVVAELGAVP